MADNQPWANKETLLYNGSERDPQYDWLTALLRQSGFGETALPTQQNQQATRFLYQATGGVPSMGQIDSISTLLGQGVPQGQILDQMVKSDPAVKQRLMQGYEMPHYDATQFQRNFIGNLGGLTSKQKNDAIQIVNDQYDAKSVEEQNNKRHAENTYMRGA